MYHARMATTVEPVAPPEQVDMKQAIQIAMRHVADLFNQKVSDLLFEEIESDEESWHITVSLPLRSSLKTFQQIIQTDLLSGGRAGPREFKTVTVRRSDGEPTSVQIRNLNLHGGRGIA